MPVPKTRNVFKISLDKKLKRTVSEYQYRHDRDELILEELKRFPEDVRKTVEIKATELYNSLDIVAKEKQKERERGGMTITKPFIPSIDSLKVLIVLIALRKDVVRLK